MENVPISVEPEEIKMNGNKGWRGLLIGCLALLLVVCSFGGGMVTGQVFPRLVPSATPLAMPTAETGQDTPTDLDTLFAPFWQSWNLVHEMFVDQPVDDVKLMQGAISGMMNALGDEHSSYMDPQEYSDATLSLSGEYEGIGAYVDTGGEFLTIISPIPDSPAEKAGLRPGDRILKIDGEDMTGVAPEAARQRVLGPAGTDVTLTISREGVDQPFDVILTRAQITIASVIGEMRDDNIAYVQINTFGDDTAEDLHAILEELMAQNPRGMILDLRYNGGGYLDIAVKVASEFIPSGVVLYEQFGDGTRQSYEVEPGGLATEIPLVVLVNEGSASASEILAGAIQDYGRGKLVGVTTYGKGSVQNWIPLDNEQGAVRITIARWLTPNGNSIDKQGLTPDIVVEFTEDDYNNNIDPQLDAAVQYLLK